MNVEVSRSEALNGHVRPSTSRTLQELASGEERRNGEHDASQRLEIVQDDERHLLEAPPLPKTKAITIIITLAGITFLNSVGSGTLIGALPRIAKELRLSGSLLLFPASVYALAAGCLLLVFGAVADVVGTTIVWLVGCFLYMIFTVAVGLSRTGVQLIIFRILSGASIAMCLPTSVSLITNTFPRGNYRNAAFAINGVGQPLGFSFGLMVGGIFTDTIGWRWNYYIMALINLALFASAIPVLPFVRKESVKPWRRRLIEDIDWVGAGIISLATGLLLYVLAAATSSYRRMGEASSIIVLLVSLALLVAFPLWMNLQARRSRPALIPNSLWRNAAFTATCVAVFFCWAAFNAIEYFIMLYFQQVLKITAIQSSLRFLPHVIAGFVTEVVTGFLISRVELRTLVIVSGLITLAAAPVMATLHVQDSYWLAAFWGLLLSPINPDVLFTASNLVISNAFAPDTQSIAGGVFNQVAQLGNAVGLAVTASIASSVTSHSDPSRDPVDALMKGYRAAFWTILASSAVVLPVAWFGYKRAGTVGKKDE